MGPFGGLFTSTGPLHIGSQLHGHLIVFIINYPDDGRKEEPKAWDTSSSAGKPWGTSFGAGKPLDANFGAGKPWDTSFLCRQNLGTLGGRTHGLEALPTPARRPCTRPLGYRATVRVALVETQESGLPRAP